MQVELKSDFVIGNQIENQIRFKDMMQAIIQ